MRDHAALLRYFEQRRNMPFAWGSAANDCASFAALAVEAQTGVNPLGDVVWTSEGEANAVMEAIGGMMKGVSDRLRLIPAAMARRGDVAGVMSGNQLGLMIVETAMLVGPGVSKMMRRPRSDMRFAWSAD